MPATVRKSIVIFKIAWQFSNCSPQQRHLNHAILIAGSATNTILMLATCMINFYKNVFILTVYYYNIHFVDNCQ